MIKHKGVIVNELVVHTAATPGDWWKGKTIAQMVKIIKGWHSDPTPLGRGWSDIGYHRVIAPNGEIGIGRSLWTPGAHVRGHNLGTIGVCLVPIKWIDKMGTFEDYYTQEQRVALEDYIYEVNKLTPIEKISGHNEYANKLCPGFKVNETDWLQ